MSGARGDTGTHGRRPRGRVRESDGAGNAARGRRKVRPVGGAAAATPCGARVSGAAVTPGGATVSGAATRRPVCGKGAADALRYGAPVR